MAFATLDSSINGADFTYSNGDLTVEKTSGAIPLSTQLDQSFTYNYRRYYFEVVADVLDAVNPFTGKMHFGIVPVLRADDTDSLESSRPVGSQFFLNSTSAPGFERVTWNTESDLSCDLDATDYNDHPMVGAGWDDTDVLGCVIDEVIPGETTGDGVIQVSWYLNGAHIGTMDSGTYSWRGIAWTVAISLVDVNDQITIRTDPADWTQTPPHWEVLPLATSPENVIQTSVDTGYCRMTSGQWPICHRNQNNPVNNTYDKNISQMLWLDRDRLQVFNPQDGVTPSPFYSVEAMGTIPRSRGKFYFEVTLDGTDWQPSAGRWQMGWFMGPKEAAGIGAHQNFCGLGFEANTLVNFFGGTGPGNLTVANGDVLHFAVNLDLVDLDAGAFEQAWFVGQNGTWIDDPDSVPAGSFQAGLRLGGASSKGHQLNSVYPGIKLISTGVNPPHGSETCTFNFGGTAFVHTVPTGYVGWDTTSIPV